MESTPSHPPGRIALIRGTQVGPANIRAVHAQSDLFYISSDSVSIEPVMLVTAFEPFFAAVAISGNSRNKRVGAVTGLRGGLKFRPGSSYAISSARAATRRREHSGDRYRSAPELLHSLPLTVRKAFHGQ
jgi:hypothetical protein